MSERAERCETCRWWQANQSAEKDEKITWGRCHRHAPMPKDEDWKEDSQWPVVTVWSWCGEWQVKP